MIEFNLKHSCVFFLVCFCFFLFSLLSYPNKYKWQFLKNTEPCISFHIQHDQMCLLKLLSEFLHHVGDWISLYSSDVLTESKDHKVIDQVFWESLPTRNCFSVEQKEKLISDLFQEHAKHHISWERNWHNPGGGTKHRYKGGHRILGKMAKAGL